MTEAAKDVTEIIAEKLVKRLSVNALRALGCIALPTLEGPKAEVSCAKLYGLDKFRLHPDYPAKVDLTDRHMLLSIPLQVQNVKLIGKYTQLCRPTIAHGKLYGHLRNLRIDAEVAIGGSYPKLKTLQVIKLEGFELTSAKGMTIFFNWFLLDLIDNFINKNQGRLFKMIREALWNAFAMHIVDVLPLLDVQYLSRKQESGSDASQS